MLKFWTIRQNDRLAGSSGDNLTDKRANHILDLGVHD